MKDRTEKGQIWFRGSKDSKQKFKVVWPRGSSQRRKCLIESRNQVTLPVFTERDAWSCKTFVIQCIRIRSLRDGYGLRWRIYKGHYCDFLRIMLNVKLNVNLEVVGEANVQVDLKNKQMDRYIKRVKKKDIHRWIDR